MAPKLDDNILRKELRSILPQVDSGTATIKTIMSMLSKRLNISIDELKDLKPLLKTLIADLIVFCKDQSVLTESDSNEEISEQEEGQKISSEDESAKSNSGSEEDSSDNWNERSTKAGQGRNGRKRTGSSRSKAHPSKKIRKGTKSQNSRLDALKELAKAAGLLNPAIYKSLKNAGNDNEAEELLRSRLDQANVHFSGKSPTRQDIIAAKKKRDLAQEMDGIDTSLIINKSQSRRACRSTRTAQSEMPEYVSYNSDPEKNGDSKRTDNTDESSEASCDLDDE